MTMLPTRAAVGVALDGLLTSLRPGPVPMDMTAGASGETRAPAAAMGRVREQAAAASSVFTAPG